MREDDFMLVFALQIFCRAFFCQKGLFAMKTSTKNLTSAAMLCAASYILMLLSKFVPQVAGFLQFDAKDVREFALSFGRRYRENTAKAGSGVTVRVLANDRSG
ncbi:MAG: hypothetical protein IKA95_04645, partial [Clostridia bacterium]|nr:hypothetical protein [Clostridia bacterium]